MAPSQGHGRGLFFPTVWSAGAERSVTEPIRAQAQCPSDDELMSRLCRNDASAIELLFARYSRLVLGIALRVLHDRGEAEEVVQDAFFSVFQSARLFEPSKGTAKAWIVQIAFHRALDRKSFLDRRGFYLGTDVECLDYTLFEKADLDREIEAKLLRVQIDKAFEELPEVQRRTLELFYFEGLELREISEKLNEPLGNVRHHFYRGLERLRKSTFIQALREK